MKEGGRNRRRKKGAKRSGGNRGKEIQQNIVVSYLSNSIRASNINFHCVNIVREDSGRKPFKSKEASLV